MRFLMKMLAISVGLCAAKSQKEGALSSRTLSGIPISSSSTLYDVLHYIQDETISSTGMDPTATPTATPTTLTSTVVKFSVTKDFHNADMTAFAQDLGVKEKAELITELQTILSQSSSAPVNIEISQFSWSNTRTVNSQVYGTLTFTFEYSFIAEHYGVNQEQATEAYKTVVQTLNEGITTMNNDLMTIDAPVFGAVSVALVSVSQPAISFLTTATPTMMPIILDPYEKSCLTVTMAAMGGHGWGNAKLLMYSTVTADRSLHAPTCRANPTTFDYCFNNQPSMTPTSRPTVTPTTQPSRTPTMKPTPEPTPTDMPTAEPTEEPTYVPSSPSTTPTSKPSKNWELIKWREEQAEEADYLRWYNRWKSSNQDDDDKTSTQSVGVGDTAALTTSDESTTADSSVSQEQTLAESQSTGESTATTEATESTGESTVTTEVTDATITDSSTGQNQQVYSEGAALTMLSDAAAQQSQSSKSTSTNGDAYLMSADVNVKRALSSQDDDATMMPTAVPTDAPDIIIMKVVGLETEDADAVSWRVVTDGVTYVGNYETTLIFTVRPLVINGVDYTSLVLLSATGLVIPPESNECSTPGVTYENRMYNGRQLTPILMTPIQLPPVQMSGADAAGSGSGGSGSSSNYSANSTAVEVKMEIGYTLDHFVFDVNGMTDALYGPKVSFYSEDNSLVASSVLSDNGTLACNIQLSDGAYTMKVTKSLVDDSTVNWKFCHKMGRIGAELHFTIEGDTCTPTPVKYVVSTCVETRYRPKSSLSPPNASLAEALVTVGGLMELHGVGRDELSPADSKLLRSAITEEFTDANLGTSPLPDLATELLPTGALPGQRRLGGDEQQGVTKQVAFKVTMSVPKFEMADLKKYLDHSMTSGLFVTRVRSMSKVSASPRLGSLSKASLLDLHVVHQTLENEEVSMFASVVVAVCGVVGLALAALLVVRYQRMREFKYELAPVDTEHGMAN